MRVEIGRSYRLVRHDGYPEEMVTVERRVGAEALGVVLLSNGFRALDSGALPAIGQLVELDAPQEPTCGQTALTAETKRPTIGCHDPDERERFRRTFATWDFRQCT